MKLYQYIVRNYYSIILLLFTIFLSSCSKDEEAKLEGRWQGITIDSPRHAQVSDSLFFSFDSGVCQIQTLKSSSPHFAERIFSNYILKEDSIKISIPNEYFGMAKANRYLDWNTNQRKFAIRELSSKSLKLSVNDTIYSFRKYY